MLDELLAPYDEEIAAFNRNWIGPAKYESHKETLVARYDAEGDGQPVEIYCTAMPARFYTLKALAGKNSIGKLIAPFEFMTGSGGEAAKLIAQMGKAIASGMLGFNQSKDQMSKRRDVRIDFDDGDHFVSFINGTKQEVEDYYAIGLRFNVGFGPLDNFKTISKLTFLD